MNMLQQSPILQQALGTSLPSMFLQFLSLSGLKGFEQFDPNYQDEDSAALPGNLNPNSLQAIPPNTDIPDPNALPVGNPAALPLARPPAMPIAANSQPVP